MDDSGLVPMETVTDEPSATEPDEPSGMDYHIIHRHSTSNSSSVSVGTGVGTGVDIREIIVPVRPPSSNPFTRMWRRCSVNAREAAHRRDLARAVAAIESKIAADRALAMRQAHFPETSVTEDNRVTWRINGMLGRYGDFPSIVITTGEEVIKIWHRNGERHRANDLPAYIKTRGTKICCKSWYRNGKLHRDGDLPAYIELPNTTCFSKNEWYRDGQRHRGDDKPAVVHTYIRGRVTSKWYYKDKLHRRNGFAVIGATFEKWKHGRIYYSTRRCSDVCWKTYDRNIIGGKPNFAAMYLNCTYRIDGTIKTHVINGMMLDYDKPYRMRTCTKYHKNGVMYSHCVNRVPYEPSIRVHCKSRTISITSTDYTYDSNGNLHSFHDKPAYCEYSQKCMIVGSANNYRLVSYERTVLKMYFYTHGVLHRTSGAPAYIKMRSTDKCVIVWIKNGVIHRNGVDAPAIIECSISNSDILSVGTPVTIRYIHYEEWYVDGSLGRVSNLPTNVGKCTNDYQLNRIKQFISNGGVIDLLVIKNTL